MNTRSTWFDQTFGFTEFDASEVRANIEYHEADSQLTSKANGRTFTCGKFLFDSMREVNEQLAALSGGELKTEGKNMTLTNKVDDVRALIYDTENSGAVFQAASQFNCLEMINPHRTPEDGITCYVNDNTQGPICAIACPAGTLQRNYLISLHTSSLTFKGPGQTHSKQIDGMSEVGDILGNVGHKYWKMSNGYLLPVGEDSLAQLNEKLSDKEVRQRCMESVRVGVHEETEVYVPSKQTSNPGEPGHLITQIYSSGCPVQYDRVTKGNSRVSKRRLWSPMATLVLDATYDIAFATAARLSLERGGERVKLFLTKVGGGVFGNPDTWIIDSIRKSLMKYRAYNIDVTIVHYGGQPSIYGSLKV